MSWKKSRRGRPSPVFCLSLKMEDVLVRGPYQGARRFGGVRCGVAQSELGL